MRCVLTDIFTCFAGELPKELGKLVKLTYFDVSGNSIGGKLYVPAYMRLCVLLTFPPCFTGELPKELGQLVNLEAFNVSGSSVGGGLYVPCYIRNLDHAHNGVLCVCTLTKQEKTALKAKLPKIQHFTI